LDLGDDCYDSERREEGDDCYDSDEEGGELRREGSWSLGLGPEPGRAAVSRTIGIFPYAPPDACYPGVTNVVLVVLVDTD